MKKAGAKKSTLVETIQKGNACLDKDEEVMEEICRRTIQGALPMHYKAYLMF